MRRKLTTLLLAVAIGALAVAVVASKTPSSIIRPTQTSLMNEVRESPSPIDGEKVAQNPPRFMWADKYPHLGVVLDGAAEHYNEIKPKVTYRIRISQSEDFSRDVIEQECHWAFYTPSVSFDTGRWYWQHAYVDADGAEEWSQVLSFTVTSAAVDFNPPSYEELVERLPKEHPYILFDSKKWDSIIERNRNNSEAEQYFALSATAMNHPLLHLAEEIDTTGLAPLKNAQQRKSLLIRESRKIVDREERYIEALVRAYILSKDESYYREALRRFEEVASWDGNRYFAGDFNLSTLLMMSTSLYDAGYNIISDTERDFLRATTAKYCEHFYAEYVNHLENRIADNHVWQMTLRILTFGSFAILGDDERADEWAAYCYNMWVSRFPGLNNDGSWHNGDSYFHVNMRTLIEVPAFYSRITGFDFFADEWYNNNALYTIYHQPPFSKSAGHGSSHEDKHTPSGVKVGYADALSRETQNPYITAYLYDILSEDPAIMTTTFMGKSGDLTWYRCTTEKPRAERTVELSSLPSCKVFNENGVATMHSAIGDYRNNAMLSFRSSPYGSTSHSHANQNAFNTFYGGEEIFYSSGHRTGFVDPHTVYSYRATRAHNSILIDGMGQRIGTDGYGWIPRYYEGESISYFVGDASNGYGKISTPLWLQRAEIADVEFTPENGWDENKLDMFRRHVIQLGASGLVAIYDELQAKVPVEWSYLLHTRKHRMDIEAIKGGSGVVVKAKNDRDGESVAHLFCSVPFTTDQTNEFFYPADDWMQKSKSGYDKNWHFTAKSERAERAYFLTIIDTHNVNSAPLVVEYRDGVAKVGDWEIITNLESGRESYIKVVNRKQSCSLTYDMTQNSAKTIIIDHRDGERVKVALSDEMPQFEI